MEIIISYTMGIVFGAYFGFKMRQRILERIEDTQSDIIFKLANQKSEDDSND